MIDGTSCLYRMSDRLALKFWQMAIQVRYAVGKIEPMLKTRLSQGFTCQPNIGHHH